MGVNREGAPLSLLPEALLVSTQSREVHVSLTWSLDKFYCMVYPQPELNSISGLDLPLDKFQNVIPTGRKATQVCPSNFTDHTPNLNPSVR